MRTAIITSAGDVFLISLALQMFRKYWYDEVDELYVCINNNVLMPREVIGEFLAKQALDPKLHLLYHPYGIGAGLPLKEAILSTKAEYVLLLEEDCVIFESGVVNKYFNDIESGGYDVLGSPRGSAGEELYKAEVDNFGMIESDLPDTGPNLWPNMLFAKKETLLKTDLDFGSHAWYPDEYSEELHYTFKDRSDGDTWVWATVQMRSQEARIKAIPQHHFSPTELTDKDQLVQNYDPRTQPFNYIHFGSLSSGWNGYLKEGFDGKQLPSMLEMENRLAAWLLCAENTEGYDAFKSQYIARIHDTIKTIGVDFDQFRKKYDLLKNLLKL